MNALASVSPALSRASCDTNHYYCCDKDRGLCGIDLTGHDEVTDVDCVVCVDLDDADAPCGPGCPLAVLA